MSDCVIFITGTSTGTPQGFINMTGTAQESIRNEANQWVCYVSYQDNAAAMHAKIRDCVKEMYLRDWGITIGGSDKMIIMGGAT